MTPFFAKAAAVAKISSVANAICCTPDPNASDRNRDDCVRADCEAFNAMRNAAASAYEARFDPEVELSQQVLIPAVAEEKFGIEDARFVRFTDDDGSQIQGLLLSLRFANPLLFPTMQVNVSPA